MVFYRNSGETCRAGEHDSARRYEALRTVADSEGGWIWARMLTERCTWYIWSERLTLLTQSMVFDRNGSNLT